MTKLETFMGRGWDAEGSRDGVNYFVTYYLQRLYQHRYQE